MIDKINPTYFYTYNVADTCAIWNILSSKILYNAANTADCIFCCTNFVYYECLIKPRKNISPTEKELIGRLQNEIKKCKQFINYHLNIEDLQEIEILEQRKKIGKGELSSIVFAKKTRQAFLTDDKNARLLAESVIEMKMIQTTPHLLGWLFYKSVLFDPDKEKIIEEHSKFRPTRRGNLSEFFEKMYLKAFEYKLMNQPYKKN